MNFDDLILNKQARLELTCYLKRPTHALMLVGNKGVGLGTIAKTLAKTISKNNVIYICPTIHKSQKTPIISSEDIDGLTDLVRDKRLDSLTIVMDDADQTNSGVFEKILKIIEEPNANLNFIFTSHNTAQIPATILSRTQKITIKTPSAADCSVLLKEADPTTRQQINFLAANLPAEICRLQNDHQKLANIAEVITLAKIFLSGSLDDRLDIAGQVKTRDNAIALVDSLTKLIYAVISSSKEPAKQASNLHLLSSAKTNLKHNASPKAQLTNLALNF